MYKKKSEEFLKIFYLISQSNRAQRQEKIRKLIARKGAIAFAPFVVNKSPLLTSNPEYDWVAVSLPSGIGR